MKTLERAFPWLLTTPVILPLIVWGGVVYPYLVPKTLLFYALALVTLALFVVLVAYDTSFFWHRVRHWTAWVPGLLFVLAYVASYFGIGFYHSFWSIFVRGDGLLMLTCMNVYFYLILLSADRRFFDRLIYAAAGVGSIVAVYGIGEWLLSGGRIGSLLGNAAFFAGYLGIALYATLAASKSAPRAWRAALVAGAALEVIAIVLTATRGTMLALIVALLATLGYFAWKGEDARKKWSAWTLVGIVIFGGLFFAFRSELAQVPFQPIARVASIRTSETDVASRLFIWSHMVGEIAKRPVLGVGAEHINYLFDQFYDPTKIVEQWFDRSHNAFLDYAAQYGVGGLVLYLLLIGSFFVGARRLYARGEKCLAGFFALLAVTYAVQNFFVFDTVSSFWLLLALLASLLAVTSAEEEAAPLGTAGWTKYSSWLAALVFVVLIVPVSVRPAIAAYDLAHSYALALVDPAASVAYMKNGYALGTYGNLEYGYEVHEMYASHEHGALTGSDLTAAYDEAVAVLTENFRRYPYDARTALDLAQVLSLAPAGTTPDSGLLSSAIARAVALSPKRTQPWFILVNLSLSQANSSPQDSAARSAGYKAAEDILSRYIALVPTLSEPHYVLAELYYAEGSFTEAAKEAALGKQYYTSDAETAVRAAQYYENVKDWNDAKVFLLEVQKLSPTNYPLIYDLAKVDYVLGDYTDSAAVVTQLSKDDPQILGTDPAFSQAIAPYLSPAR